MYALNILPVAAAAFFLSAYCTSQDQMMVSALATPTTDSRRSFLATTGATMGWVIAQQQQSGFGSASCTCGQCLGHDAGCGCSMCIGQHDASCGCGSCQDGHGVGCQCSQCNNNSHGVGCGCGSCSQVGMRMSQIARLGRPQAAFAFEPRIVGELNE